MSASEDKALLRRYLRDVWEKQNPSAGLVDMIRVKDGKFVEQWGGPDLFDLLRQLGVAFTVATKGTWDWRRLETRKYDEWA